MILRKPYSFLIKHFKLIHIILTALMIFISFRSNRLLSFFKEYINTGTFIQTGNLATSYINTWMYLAILAIILISLIIYILMRQKKKPTLLYIIIMAFYLGLIIVYFQAHNTLSQIEITTLNPQILRVIRDIILIFTVSQYGVITLIAVRAVGFDIKKFNFGEDLQQLEIEETDNEEFELKVGVDSSVIGRKIRAQRREIKYFIIENLFVISLATIITITTVSVGLFLNFQVYNKVYKEKAQFRVNDLITKVNSSYITSLNYKGQTITPTGKTYVIVDLYLQNVGVAKRKIALDNINLIIGKQTFTPKLERYQSFFDLGTGYTDQIIKSGEKSKFLFMFEIDQNLIKERMIFRVTESLYYKSGDLTAKYKKVLLKPTLNNKITVMSTANLGDKIWLGESTLKDSSLTINDINFDNRFEYEGTVCVQNVCDTVPRMLLLDYYAINKTLFKINPTYKVSKLVSNMKLGTTAQVITKFGEIKYRIGHKDYGVSMINRTPNDLSNDLVILEVPENMTTANSIELVLTIRNLRYIFILKTSE